MRPGRGSGPARRRAALPTAPSTLCPRRRPHPGDRLRASAHTGSLFPRLTSSLLGEAGERAPSRPRPETWLESPAGPTGSGALARSGYRASTRVHSQPRCPSPRTRGVPARVRRPGRRSRRPGRIPRGRGRRHARPPAAASRPLLPACAHLGPRRRLRAHFRESGCCARLWVRRGGAGRGAGAGRGRG